MPISVDMKFVRMSQDDFGAIAFTLRTLNFSA